MENYNVIEVISDNGIPYFQWENIPPKSTLGFGHIGKRVWIAGELSGERKYLYAVHFKGDKFWPNENGFTIKTKDGYTQSVNENSCRLHPSEYSDDNNTVIELYDSIIEDKRNVFDSDEDLDIIVSIISCISTIIRIHRNEYTEINEYD